MYFYILSHGLNFSRCCYCYFKELKSFIYAEHSVSNHFAALILSKLNINVAKSNKTFASRYSIILVKIILLITIS